MISAPAPTGSQAVVDHEHAARPGSPTRDRLQVKRISSHTGSITSALIPFSIRYSRSAKTLDGHVGDAYEGHISALRMTRARPAGHS